MKPRIKARTPYKRVLMVFDQKPRPLWRELLARKRTRLVPMQFDGRYWIEATSAHGAHSSRVVRASWPAYLEHEQADTDGDLAGRYMRAGWFVRSMMVADDRDYMDVVGYWPFLAWALALWLASNNWYIFLPLAAGSAFLLRLILRGGLGNMGQAKAMCGIHRPFMLTPYQLLRHVEARQEMEQAEGLMATQGV